MGKADRGRQAGNAALSLLRQVNALFSSPLCEKEAAERHRKLWTDHPMLEADRVYCETMRQWEIDGTEESLAAFRQAHENLLTQWKRLAQS